MAYDTGVLSARCLPAVAQAEGCDDEPIAIRQYLPQERVVESTRFHAVAEKALVAR